MNIALRIAAACEALVDGVGRFAAWFTLALVLLISTNVLLRYAFSYGSVASQELEWHLLAVVALWGVAYTQQAGEHVRVDILYQNYSHRAKLWLDFFTAVFVMLPFALIICWLSLGFVDQAYVNHEISPDPGGLEYRFILKSFITTGFALLVVQSVATAVRIMLRIRSEEKE